MFRQITNSFDKTRLHLFAGHHLTIDLKFHLQPINI